MTQKQIREQEAADAITRQAAACHDEELGPRIVTNACMAESMLRFAEHVGRFNSGDRGSEKSLRFGERYGSATP